MKKTIITILILLGLFVLYYFVSPLWKNTVINEQIPVSENISNEDSDLESKENISLNQEVGNNNSTNVNLNTNVVNTLKQGSFTGFDKLHNGSGTASLITVDGKNYIRFENDFKVTNGPDLFVGFGKNGNYIKGSEISKLKGNIGSQNYELPANFDINNISEVWIWCKAFSVPFAKAELR